MPSQLGSGGTHQNDEAELEGVVGRIEERGDAHVQAEGMGGQDLNISTMSNVNLTPPPSLGPPHGPRHIPTEGT